MEESTVSANETPASEWGAVSYERELVDRVWRRGEIVPGNDPELWRQDEFGAWIRRLDYGNRRSEFGWEIFEDSRACHWSDAGAFPLHWQNYIDEVAARTQNRAAMACERQRTSLF